MLGEGIAQAVVQVATTNLSLPHHCCRAFRRHLSTRPNNTPSSHLSRAAISPLLIEESFSSVIRAFDHSFSQLYGL